MVRIFLSEDNPGDVILVREALAAHQIESTLWVATNGTDAMQAAKEICEGEVEIPDVFLLDINLPRIDGFAVLERLRSQPRCASVPVIIVTSSNNVLDRNRAASLGVAHYFRKPSDFDEFLKLGALIKAVLPDPAGRN